MSLPSLLLALLLQLLRLKVDNLQVFIKPLPYPYPRHVIVAPDRSNLTSSNDMEQLI